MYFTTIESIKAELDYRTENAHRGRGTQRRGSGTESRVRRRRGRRTDAA